MRKEFKDDIFDLEDSDVKDLFNNFVYKLENKLQIELYGLKHEFELFKLFCICNIGCLEESLNQLVNTIYYIMDAYSKEKNQFKDMVKICINKRDEALNFFWEYLDEVERYKKIRSEKYNFRSKANTLLNLFQRLIENIIKREAYLLCQVNFIMKNDNSININDRLYDIIQNIFTTPTYNNLSDFQNKLSGISINQYRNIVAHSSFTLRNNKIYAFIGKNKEKGMTLDEAEEIFLEIYKLRLWLKLCLNLTIDIMLNIYPELRRLHQVIPESFIISFNSALKENGITVESYEIADSFVLDNNIINQKDQVFFTLEVISKKHPIIETITILLLTIEDLYPMFSEKNNFPSLCDVMWVFKIKYDEKLCCLFIGYDEIKKFIINPLEYVDYIVKKINNDICQKKELSKFIMNT